MSWRCGQCGFSGHRPGATGCERCGESPPVLVLGEGPGALRLRIATVVGRRLLQALVGEDARYVAELQLRVERDAARAAWIASPVPGAANATHVDGAPLDGPCVLGEGMMLSVGPRGHAALRVSFGDG